MQTKSGKHTNCVIQSNLMRYKVLTEIPNKMKFILNYSTVYPAKTFKFKHVFLLFVIVKAETKIFTYLQNCPMENYKVDKIDF